MSRRSLSIAVLVLAAGTLLAARAGAANNVANPQNVETPVNSSAESNVVDSSTEDTTKPIQCPLGYHHKDKNNQKNCIANTPHNYNSMFSGFQSDETTSGCESISQNDVCWNLALLKGKSYENHSLSVSALVVSIVALGLALLALLHASALRTALYGRGGSRKRPMDDSLTGRINVAGADITELREYLSKMKASISSLERDLSAAYADFKALKEHLANLTTSVNSLEQGLGRPTGYASKTPPVEAWSAITDRAGIPGQAGAPVSDPPRPGGRGGQGGAPGQIPRYPSAEDVLSAFNALVANTSTNEADAFRRRFGVIALSRSLQQVAPASRDEIFWFIPTSGGIGFATPGLDAIRDWQTKFRSMLGRNAHEAYDQYFDILAGDRLDLILPATFRRDGQAFSLVQRGKIAGV